MLFRISIVICMVCIGTLSFAQPHTESVIHNRVPIVQNNTYKTEDILLLFKSCYETIYFLGNTKYQRTKKILKEEDVSKQCFCICDKVREKHNPKQFLVKSPLEIHNIIAPLANDCLKDTLTHWYDDVDPDMEKKDDS